MSLVLEQIKTQELVGGSPRRQPILGFSVLVNLATAILLRAIFKSLSEATRSTIFLIFAHSLVMLPTRTQPSSFVLSFLTKSHSRSGVSLITATLVLKSAPPTLRAA
jgi:hypothetical protein